MNKNLLILGAGMFGAVIKEIAEDTGLFEKIDFLDDSFGSGELEGKFHEESIGKLDDYQNFFPDYEYAIVSIGDPKVRIEWTKKLYYASYKIPIIVSKQAYVSKTAQLCKGVVVGPMAVINPHTHIGEGTFIMAGAVIDHNTFVADYCNIQCGSVVMPSNLLQTFTVTEPNEVARMTGTAFTLDNFNGETIIKSVQKEFTTD